MSHCLAANNANTTIASALSAVATTVNLAPGTGATFPHPTASPAQFFIATLTDQATGQQNEIVYVTNVTGDVATIVRGQEGTAPRSWNVGDFFANLMTAGTMALFAQPDDLQAQAGNAGVDTGTANAIVIAPTVQPATLAATAGVPFRIKKGANANTGPTTVKIGTLPAAALTLPGGVALGANQLPANGYLSIVGNGVTFELQSQGASGSPPPAGVSSFNGRTGVVLLTSGDVTTALGFTPLSRVNNLSDLQSLPTALVNLGFDTTHQGSGYYILPNGLIVQWGSQIINQTEGLYGPYNFSIAFPSVCYGVHLTTITLNTDGSPEYSENYNQIPSNHLPGLSQFFVFCNSPHNSSGDRAGGFYWLAWGR